jgi:hypothetical protein
VPRFRTGTQSKYAGQKGNSTIMKNKNRSESVHMAPAEIFAPRSAAQLRHRKDDLLHRAGLVTEFGWDQFRHQWSPGEVLATALLLNDNVEITRWAETVDSALSRWAFDLWGLVAGQADLDSGLPATRAWFDSVRAELQVNASANRHGK